MPVVRFSAQVQADPFDSSAGLSGAMKPLFVVITDSREHAEFWKERIGLFLAKEMKLTLSPEKTLITDVRKRYIQFLGYEYKVVRGNSRKGYIPRTIPNRKRLKRKIEEIHANIVSIPANINRDVVIQRIHLINSQIRGLVNYYENTTWVTVAFKRYRQYLQRAAHKALKKYSARWVRADKTSTLPSVHGKWFCILFGNQFSPDEVYDHYPADRLMVDIPVALMAVQTATTEALSEFPMKPTAETKSD